MSTAHTPVLRAFAVAAATMMGAQSARADAVVLDSRATVGWGFFNNSTWYDREDAVTQPIWSTQPQSIGTAFTVTSGVSVYSFSGRADQRVEVTRGAQPDSFTSVRAISSAVSEGSWNSGSTPGWTDEFIVGAKVDIVFVLDAQHAVELIVSRAVTSSSLYALSLVEARLVAVDPTTGAETFIPFAWSSPPGPPWPTMPLSPTAGTAVLSPGRYALRFGPTLSTPRDYEPGSLALSSQTDIVFSIPSPAATVLAVLAAGQAAARNRRRR